MASSIDEGTTKECSLIETFLTLTDSRLRELSPIHDGNTEQCSVIGTVLSLSDSGLRE